MESVLISPKDGTEAVKCLMNGVVRMDSSQFADWYRTRIDNGMLYEEYKCNGKWYVTAKMTQAQMEAEAREEISEHGWELSPLQE